MLAVLKALIKTIMVIGVIILLFLLCYFKPVICASLFAGTIIIVTFIGFYLNEEDKQ